MGTELVVERPGRPIELHEWRGLVETDQSMRWRTAPSEPVNPATGENIIVAEPLWEAEWHSSGAYLPLLRYVDGVLRVRLASGASDAFLEKVEQIAGQLGGEMRSLP